MDKIHVKQKYKKVQNQSKKSGVVAWLFCMGAPLKNLTPDLAEKSPENGSNFDEKYLVDKSPTSGGKKQNRPVFRDKILPIQSPLLGNSIPHSSSSFILKKFARKAVF